MVGKFIWDSALFSGGAPVRCRGCIERNGLEQENPLSNPGRISSDGTGEKKMEELIKLENGQNLP